MTLPNWAENWAAAAAVICRGLRGQQMEADCAFGPDHQVALVSRVAGRGGFGDGLVQGWTLLRVPAGIEIPCRGSRRTTGTQFNSMMTRRYMSIRNPRGIDPLIRTLGETIPPQHAPEPQPPAAPPPMPEPPYPPTHDPTEPPGPPAPEPGPYERPPAPGPIVDPPLFPNPAPGPDPMPNPDPTAGLLR